MWKPSVLSLTVELLLINRDSSKGGELDLECCRVRTNVNLLEFMHLSVFKERTKTSWNLVASPHLSLITLIYDGIQGVIATFTHFCFQNLFQISVLINSNVEVGNKGYSGNFSFIVGKLTQY